MLKSIKNNNVFFVLKLVFSCSPFYALIILLQRIVDAFIPAVQIKINADFINSVLASAEQRSLSPEAAFYLSMLILTIVISLCSEKVLYFVQVKFKIRIREIIEPRLLFKYGSLEYMHLENTDTLDIINRTLKNPEEKIVNAYHSFVDFVSFIIMVCSVAGVIIEQIWWVGIAIVAVSIPLFYISIKSGKANYQAQSDVTYMSRQSDYLYEVLTSRESAEERSFFKYSGKLRAAWYLLFEKARKKIYRTQIIWFIKVKAGGIITSLVSLFVIITLAPFAVAKTISVGAFISIVNGIISLVNRMSWDLTRLVDDLAANAEYMKDYRHFLNLSEADGAADNCLEIPLAFQSLEFRRVTFKYPGTDTYILKDMSFFVEHGKHYAIVGLNGSGKSTVVKLLTGLYREYEGDIFINGKNIKEYTGQEIKSFFTVAFQDFARYSLRIRDNLEVGNINKHSCLDIEIKNALEFMGLTEAVQKMPYGIDTYLGKLKEGGVDLSGGQWQKIALARTLINPAPVKIMDEPTAALDPISESSLYEHYGKLSSNQTTILISHRLGSTKLADYILVIDSGRVAEKGSHEELMRLHGLYSKMFEKQRSWYN